MERVGNLLEKLNGQYALGADAKAMLLTLQMLQQELLLQHGEGQKQNGNKGISIYMPAPMHLRLSAAETIAPEPPVKTPEKLVFELEPDITEVVELPAVITPAPVQQVPAYTRLPQTNGLSLKEVNETAVAAEKPSINDLLEGTPVAEVAATLQPEAIKDLRKAISINERYQFINQLFKGDETMYERSIKTINSFNVHSEASFWIRRELAVKLSWRDDDPLVQEFNQLVSRRFM